MQWHHRPSRSAAHEEVGRVTAQPHSHLGTELIHSLHLHLDYLRKAMASDHWSSEAFVPLLSFLRELFDAKVAVLQVVRPTGESHYTSADDLFLNDWISANPLFVRLCECLFAFPGPLLVVDGLEGYDFSDPQLRQEFPNLSVMKGTWSLRECTVSFAFFSQNKGHFSSGEIAILDCLRSRLLHGFLSSSWAT
jgi:hypothetical protein